MSAYAVRPMNVPLVWPEHPSEMGRSGMTEMIKCIKEMQMAPY